jgi:antirestriction protein ArdC
MSYVVFNAEQQEGAELPTTVTAAPQAAHAQCDAMIAATGAEIEHRGGEACYIFHIDRIFMPERGAFAEVEHYYATLLDELTHWTGHPSRLNRDLDSRLGSHAYAAEELIAEMGAAFLCAEAGIQGELRHAGYIESWLSAAFRPTTAPYSPPRPPPRRRLDSFTQATPDVSRRLLEGCYCPFPVASSFRVHERGP